MPPTSFDIGFSPNPCPRKLGAPHREVVEAALAHAVTNQTEAAYARSDLFERRRRLMDEWAAYLVGEPGREVRVAR